MADGEYWNDPVFQGMSAHDQMAYMQSQDPVVQKMSPQDQLGYLMHIQGVSGSIQGPQLPQPQGVGPTLGADTSTVPNPKTAIAMSGSDPSGFTGEAITGATGAGLAGLAAGPLAALGAKYPAVAGGIGSAIGYQIGGWPGAIIGHAIGGNLKSSQPEPQQTPPPPLRGSSLPPAQAQTAPPPLRGTSLPPQQAQAPPSSFRWGGQPEPAAQTGGPGPSSLSNPVGAGAKDLQPLQRASSRITHDAYDPQNQLATFRFPNGQVTEYHGISPQNWADYKNSPSLGQGFEQNIINKASASRPIPRLTGGQKAAQALRKP